MAGSMNMVLLIGRLGRDPDIRGFEDGTRYARLSLATSEKWKDKQTGEPHERTEWHQVVVFAPSAVDYIEHWFRSGSLVRVTGCIETRSWDDVNVKRYITEVVLRPYKGEVSLLRDGRPRDKMPYDHPSDSSTPSSYHAATEE